MIDKLKNLFVIIFPPNQDKNCQRVLTADFVINILKGIIYLSQN